jgi:hypothetical protein
MTSGLSRNRALRRWLSSALATAKPMNARTKLIVAVSLFVVSFATKSLQAVDLESVMYTTEQPFGGLTALYDERAVSILNGDGLLGPYDIKPSVTIGLAQAPGYSIYLSGIYSVAGRDFFRVQLIQNALNSISPVLIFLIAGVIVSWRVGAVAGLLAALSHHLSHISNFILPDSLCAVPLIGAVLLLALCWRNRLRSYWLYIAAGALLGMAVWLRPQSMLLGPFLAVALTIVSARRWAAAKRLAVMAVVSLLVIAPITIRNRLVYGAFVPINIGVGLNLWEGIAEASGNGFGAVAKDDGVAEQEAAIYDNPRYAGSSYSPDGIERDQDRTRKSFAIIRAHPFWYARVMLDRMRDMLKYSAHAPLVLKSRPDSSGPTFPLNPNWQQAVTKPTAFANALNWLRVPVRALQRATKETMLAFVLIGAAVFFFASWRRAFFISMTPVYYLFFQSLMHSEFRYTLPMHYFLFVFAAVVWVLIWSVTAAGGHGLIRTLSQRREDAKFAKGLNRGILSQGSEYHSGP